MNFAKRVFFWSGVYGVVVLSPMYFLEEMIGRHYPPATNHPEQYYAFLGAALAWQLAFLLIAQDPLRYRPLMIPAIAEKMLAAFAVIWLFMSHRVNTITLAPFMVDLFLGVLFIISYVKTTQNQDRAVDTAFSNE